GGPRRYAARFGHGSGTSWSTTSFSVTKINALENGYKNPFVFDVACLNGDFTMGECMEEAWLRAGDLNNPKGAIAIYGSTTNASWVPPCDMQYHAMELLTMREKMTVGGVCFSGLMHGMDVNGGSTGEGLKMMEQFHIFGDPMTKLTFGLFPDSTAPTQITNLNASNPTSDEVMVTWSAPTDSSIGGIISYDLRYSTSQINNDNDFAAAQSVLLSGEGDTSGMPKSYTYKNLAFNTTYYFAVKSVDIWGNVSQMSNITSATTLSAPVISCTPNSFSYNLPANNIVNDSLLISNIATSPSTLTFSVETANSTFPEKALSLNIIPQITNTERSLGTKEEPINLGGISIKGSGGPDSFGYKWVDSDVSNGPAFEWNDISTTGTEATNWVATGTYSAKDEGYTTLNMGLNFKFYGSVYSTVYVTSNGFLTFVQPSGSSFTNASIPNSSAPNNYIAPFWDDLDGKTTGKVFYKSEGNKFIVQYYNWSKYSGTGVLNFQVVLYSSGKIMYYYNECTATLNSATIGIENATGSIGLQIAKDANYVKPNLAVKISAEPEWMFMNNINALIYNGNSAKVNLNVNTDDLEDGIYSLDLKIKSNDPNNTVILVPVNLTVGNIIPVELISFNASIKNNTVAINWLTATETNNSGFEIERKSDSKSWEKVGFVKGKGSTTEKQEYSFVDVLENVKSDKLIYRLKQIDFDGKVNYSKTIEVLFAPQTFSLEQNFPNPFNPSTTIRFGLPTKSNVSLKIFNSLGQLVDEIINGNYEAGYYSIQFNASHLSSGIYYYRLETEEFSQIKKMALIK
nr:C25 family cysteine peptidase [Melioribacteraceae bacterium]